MRAHTHNYEQLGNQKVTTTPRYILNSDSVKYSSVVISYLNCLTDEPEPHIRM